MNLKELQSAICTALQFEKVPENVEVVITTQLPYATCGQRPGTGVKYVGMGFDWESGQFRIEPKEKLMEVKNNVPQGVLEWRGNYHCPRCERLLSSRKNTDIQFCYHCGQWVKWMPEIKNP